ncbi:hypothetical protein ONZ45_g3121 [Pleurotus djamor]|nr:hypothetical protein ONZ45_g3121 [Pleurotus djamor]
MAMSQYVSSSELTSIANLFAQEATFYVAVSLLVSELLLTIDHEVEALHFTGQSLMLTQLDQLDFVWKRLKSGVSYVFLFNRVYAVSLRGKTVLAILLVVWMSQITLMTYGLSLSGTITISPPGSRYCRCIVDTSSRLHSDFLYYFIVPTLAFDTVAFLLTFLQLYEHVAIGRRIKETPFASYGPRSISSLILRDGFAYFLALCIVNIAWAISSTFLDPGTQNLLGFPNAAITVVLINRMFLHTRYFSSR